MVNSNHAA